MTHVELLDATPSGWDEFVRGRPEGTPFHLDAWQRCIATGLGTRARFLVAREGAEIVGVLPLHLVKSLLFGSRLVGAPQAAYGGPLAATTDVAEMLVAKATEEAESLGVDWLELRLRDALPSTQGGRWHGSDLYVTVGGPIAADSDAILAAIPKKTRADCRKADEILAGEESPEHFDQFHRLFSENQRDLGTPVLPKRFLRCIADAAELGPRVMLVVHKDTPVAACLSLTYGDTVLPYWAGAARAALEARPNHGLYLNILRTARAAGLSRYDFGRSKRGSGSYEFKKRWGFAETPLAYRYRLVRAETPPDLNPLNPKYQKKIEAWKRLPLWAANTVGPMLSPGLS
jgi:FemAB-related protein (PEP-CTERM system-associated)